MFFSTPKVQKKNAFFSKTLHLVGGWTNPSEKYARQIGNHLPQFSGWKFKKMFELPPPSLKFSSWWDVVKSLELVRPSELDHVKSPPSYPLDLQQLHCSSPAVGWSAGADARCPTNHIHLNIWATCEKDVRMMEMPIFYRVTKYSYIIHPRNLQ